MTHYSNESRDGFAEHERGGSPGECRSGVGDELANSGESPDKLDNLNTDWVALTHSWSDSPRSALVRVRQAFGRTSVYPPGYAQALQQRLADAIQAVPGDALRPSVIADSGDATERNESSVLPLQRLSRATIDGSGGVPPVVTPRLIAANSWFARYIAIAAGCIAILVFGAQGVRTAIQANVDANVNSRVYATAMGKRGTFTLPDGSVVTLNTGSRMAVDRGFGVSHRDVTLSGEAFFTVVGRPDAPFRVYAGTATTQVLGTQFTVRAYNTDSAVQVAVVQGRVLVGHTILGAGDVGQVIAQREPVVLRELDITKYTDWTNGRLAFDDVVFEQIIPQLERMFDIEIRVADAAISRRRLSGTLSDKAADHAMQYVAIMLHARYEREGRVVTLFNNSR